MGDGILALFGAPLAHEDHAVRACYAALGMQETVKRYAEEVHRVRGIPLQIRVGLNSGEVVVRSIGSDLHMDYTAVGQTTHLAARMEQMAMPGSILMAPDPAAGQVVGIVGEAGVGKSRLYWEFVHSHRTEGWTIVESASVSYGKATAYLPTIDLLRSYFQLEPRDEPRKIREKGTRTLFSLGRSP